MKTVNYCPRYAWDERLGLAHGSVEEIIHGSASWRAAQTGQITVEVYWTDVGLQLALDSKTLETFKQDYFSGDQLDGGPVDYAHALRKRGHAVALLSNDSPSLADKFAALSLADLFNPLIISANIGVMKPDAKAYEVVLKHRKCPPVKVVFIDDMIANVEGARLLGIHTIHYTTTPALQTALELLLSNAG